jgi:hypothetical protein
MYEKIKKTVVTAMIALNLFATAMISSTIRRHGSVISADIGISEDMLFFFVLVITANMVAISLYLVYLLKIKKIESMKSP